MRPSSRSRPRSIRDTFPSEQGGRTASPGTADPATPPGGGSAGPPGSPPARTRPEGSKFTVVLSPADAAMFDQLALDVRRELGRRVVKGDLVRTLVALAADDATLRAQLVAELNAAAT